MNLSDLLVVMVFGFPAVLLSLLLSAIGVFKEKVWLVIVGGVLFVPFSYYLSGAPGSAGLPLLLPGFHVGSAVAVREKHRLWAWLLLLPPLLATLWVLAVVLFSARP
ncbi:MAG TPA: hypothetical protein VK900_05530 [Anaerolineales bacterium]|nr:hypothetical protein [Anaerolineales bacterium]